jgi:hypothetical protein
LTLAAQEKQYGNWQDIEQCSPTQVPLFPGNFSLIHEQMLVTKQTKTNSLSFMNWIATVLYPE